MTDDNLLERVRQLRAAGTAPKQIARILGVAPSVVAPMVRAVAADQAASIIEPTVVGCWISGGWSAGLAVDPPGRWSDGGGAEAGGEGLVGVLVARRHRFDKVTVCGYLVDAYCLGVKNTTGPQIMGEVALREYRSLFFSAFGSSHPADLDLAQHMVLGAVEYARNLGFEPHPDFVDTAGHLGSWTGPSAITFGQNGRPFYISGPHDDISKIARTLQRAVEQGQSS